jgi:hypothetical protein
MVQMDLAWRPRRDGGMLRVASDPFFEGAIMTCEFAIAFFLGGAVFLVLFCVGFSVGVWAERERVKWERAHETPNA